MRGLVALGAALAARGGVETCRRSTLLDASVPEKVRAHGSETSSSLGLHPAGLPSIWRSISRRSVIPMQDLSGVVPFLPPFQCVLVVGEGEPVD
eukprot:s4189_g1.t1